MKYLIISGNATAILFPRFTIFIIFDQQAPLYDS